MGMPGSARAILSRTDRLNKKFSCKTTPTCRRSQVGSTWAISMPSINTRPPSGMHRRWMSLAMVLFPDPERPTMPPRLALIKADSPQSDPKLHQNAPGDIEDLLPDTPLSPMPIQDEPIVE